MKVVCLSSGGIDSTVLLFKLKKRGYSLYPLFINYGQKAYRMEKNALSKICKVLDLSFEEMDVSSIGKLSFGLTHNLISAIKYPFFPARNLLFLTIASIYATNCNIEIVAIGVIGGTSFADQTIEFIQKSKLLINESIGHRIEILAPLVRLNKLEVIRIAKDLNIPFSDTYSCYLGNDIPCNKCMSCVNRNQTFNI